MQTYLAPFAPKPAALQFKSLSRENIIFRYRLWDFQQQCKVASSNVCFNSTGRDKPGRDVPLSLCPGTRAGANVPGQTPLSRDVPGQNELKIFKKIYQIFCFRTSFTCFRTSFSCFRTSFSVSDHFFPVLERPFLLCPVLSRVPSRILAVPARHGS